jgi:hypothetical protein
MRTSITRPKQSSARAVRITEDTLIVDLQDGRSISVPLDWYPRLRHGSRAERSNWELRDPYGNGSRAGNTGPG